MLAFLNQDYRPQILITRNLNSAGMRMVAHRRSGNFFAEQVFFEMNQEDLNPLFGK